MKIFGLIGEKLSHSWSPEIHKKIYELLGIDAQYALYEVDKENIDGVSEALRVLNFSGVNVTIPYKEELLNYVDEVSKEAEKIGAINTILNHDGVLKGYNTDYYGFGRSLEHFNISIKNKRVVVLGSGGAAKAIIQYVIDNNPLDVVLVSRNKNKTKNVFQKFDVIDYEDLKDISGDIIINTTPVGMYPNCGVSPISEDIISKFNTAIDLIFNPEETEFLRIAKKKGLKTVNGLYMLVGQAVKAEEIWLNTTIESDVEESIYDYIKKSMEEKK